jgi:hypothetical protein
MKIIIKFVIVVFVIQWLFAQIVPSERRIQWTAGNGNHFSEKIMQVNVADFNAVGDGITDDTQAFMNALSSLPEDGGTIYIPNGSYLIRQSLSIDKGILFKGAGCAQTRLLFHLAGQDESCIAFVRYDRGDWVPVLAGYTKGSQKIVVTNPLKFKAGAYVEIRQANDPLIMYTDDNWNQSWAQSAVGQIMIVEAINADTLLLYKPLYMNYRQDLHPEIRTLGMVQCPGVEDLYIERLDAGDGHTIQFRYVTYGRVLRIESTYTYRTHVYLSECYGCEIRSNYFHHSHDYGGGGHGYGVDCISHSTDNLIIDNIFKHLRHSMMTHVGSSGNVFAYNFSTEREPQQLCDISLHGHYGNFNLFESNMVEEISVADYWGPMGPGNIFLRNRVTQESFLIRDASHDQNLIGNVLDRGMVSIAAGVTGTLAHGNVMRGEIYWDQNIDDHNLPVSYFLEEKPPFLLNTVWPLFGPDVQEEHLLPAQQRYLSGSPIPPAQPSEGGIPVDYHLSVYPNPFNSGTTIHFSLPRDEMVQIHIYNVLGEYLYTLLDEKRKAGVYNLLFIPERDLASGIYFVMLNTKSSMVVTKAALIK